MGRRVRAEHFLEELDVRPRHRLPPIVLVLEQLGRELRHYVESWFGPWHEKPEQRAKVRICVGRGARPLGQLRVVVEHFAEIIFEHCDAVGRR